MIPIDFSGKVALVTGVGDNMGFAWYIGKALQHAGATVVLAVQPRRLDIVENYLTNAKPEDVEARKLPDGSDFKPAKLVRCDAAYDTMADVKLEEMSEVNRRHYAKYTEDYSITGCVTAVGQEFGGIDVLIHSMAFSSEITKPLIDTSRKAYHEAMSISSYSLVGLVRAAAPFMANRPGGASVVGLTYVAGERVVPHYGGGMGTCKAALQMDAKQLAWFVGDRNIRVNLISAGPYKSRAASAIRPDLDKQIEYVAERSPLRRAIEPEEVANATLYLCSPLASAVTGQILYVDCGYNV
ncbi:MAG: SDR family oxidoreductase, partial [Gemmataceae bacterium]|nr:SDR family oxidoreductase [Gemmataceae bacterium]